MSKTFAEPLKGITKDRNYQQGLFKLKATGVYRSRLESCHFHSGIPG
jgi:hypothetical protein